jgi:hypothetical protein
VRLAEFAQELEIPRAAATEAEVVAGDHAGDAEAPCQDLRDEIFGARGRKLLVEAEHQHCVGAGMGEQLLALVECRQPERRSVGLEKAHRVRVESGGDHRPPLVESHRDRAADDRLVTEVESVEIAEREDASAQLFRNGLVVEQALHWARLYRGASGSAIRGCAPGWRALDSGPAESYMASSRSTGFPAAHSCVRRLARIAGVNIPTNKRVEIALTYIHGIGRPRPRKIADKLGIDPSAGCRT